MISDYDEWIVLITKPTNFNPNDNVNTAMDVNYTTLSDTVDLDYLLVSEDNETVSSRWFILDRKRNLTGQWNVSLRRDLISDYYADVISSPVFIEKAHLYLDNPLIFNKEADVSFNNIKSGEHLLKDESGTGWLVGYVASSFNENTTVTIAESGQAYPNSPIDYSTLSTWANSDAVTITDYWTIGYKGVVQGTVGTGKYWSIGCGKTSGSAYELTKPANFSSQILFYTANGQTVSSTGAILQSAIRDKADEIKSAMEAYIDTKAEYKRVTETQYNTLLSMNGGTFLSGSNLFTITVTNPTVESKLYENIGSDAGALYTIPYNVLQQSGTAEDYGAGSVSGINAYIPLDHLKITLSAQSVPATSVIIHNTAKILEDAPYRMFAIPLDPVTLSVPGSWSLTTKGGQFSSRLATEIAKSLGENLYDLQLLPYCPERSVLDIEEKTNTITLLGTEGVDYDLVKNSNNTPETFLVWCNRSSFSVNIDYTIDVPTDPVDFKVANETEFIRLTAPNYSASYEFKATMNRGVSGFEANCTYKPFQPYIQVNPKYNSLYGEGSLYGGDFNDQRGLVCGGDYSVALVNDAWVQYQINNKSYADAFDRQIDNMTTTYSIQREQAKRAGQINAITSAISAGVSGGMVGGALGGGPIGAAVGAGAGIVGSALSLYGLKEDLKYSDALHKEAMSLAQDNFGYQLQNIQALPYTLGKVSAFSINNKIFPFLEFYTATDIEKQALRKKIEFNGMTVGVISTINDFLRAEPTFIQCQLIRYTGDNMDNHEAVELATELHKGVYI